MSTIGIITIVVLGSLCLFFTHAIVKARLMMRGSEAGAQPRFVSSVPAAEPAQASA